MSRRLPQFRVALNSRCGRACFYCRPSGEALATSAHTSISVDRLLKVAKCVFDLGIHQIKLTGGDPALYADLEAAVAGLRALGFTEVEVISRHPNIGRRAEALALAGVTQFNMSIDTLDPTTHQKICGIDDLAAVMEALDRCVATGIACKVNVVVMAGINDREITDIIHALGARGVKTVKLLDVITDLDEGDESFARRLHRLTGSRLKDLYVPLESLVMPLFDHVLSRHTISQGDLGHPMTVLRMASGVDVVLKDSVAGSWYGSICQGCKFYPCHDALMALRLTSDERLQFCLLREDVSVHLGPIIGDSETLKSTIEGALGVFGSASFHGSAGAGDLEKGAA